MHGMARFATIVVGWASELASMDIRMAVLACRPFDSIHRPHHGDGAYADGGGRNGGNVALRARDIQVLAFQWIRRARVFWHSESAGLESLHRMARRAIAPVAARCELPLVRVGVAVQTTAEGQGPVEVRPFVAGIARHLGVFAQQRILGLGMVKHRADFDWGNLFPGERRVAGLARGLEGTVVGVGMTIGATLERDPLESQRLRIVCLRLVALLARNPRVRAGQGEACARVVEPRRGLPAVEGVAPRTVLTELALVGVLMTSEAVPREAEEAPVEVLHLDGRALRRGNARGVVALLARQPGMLAFQHVAGLRMVKALQGRFPANELEILSVVFGMTTRAVFLRGLGIHNG